MALPVRKGYTGNGVSTTLTSSPTLSDTTFTVAAVTGWPNSYPFYIVVDPGTSKEEKMRVTGVSGLTVTVVRGQDDTTAVAHSSGAVAYPVFTADEADEANRIASAMTTKGDLIVTDGSNINRLAVGTNAHVLQADSTATNGVKWGQVVEAGIATGAVTEAKIATGAVTEAKIGTGAVTSGKIANGTIVDEDINASAAIALSKLATGALPTAITVASANIVNGTIVADDLASDSVTTAKIVNNAVTNAKLDYSTVPQVTVSTSAPSGGKNGDVWIQV